MSENYVQVPSDGAGKKLRTIQRTIGANEVHDEVMEIANASGTVINPANEEGNLATIAGKDFSTETTLSQVKIKTDNIDVALSTRLKPADLNLDGEKDLQVDVKTLPTVTIGEALPAGGNNLGDVDIASLPAIPAGDNAIGRVKITDGTNVRTQTTGIGPDSSKIAGDVYVVQGKTFKMAKIDHAASGDNTVVSAVAGKKIKAYAVVLVVSGAVNCRWKSGANDLTGDMNFNGKGEGYSQAVNPPAWVMVNTNVNEALILNLSAAVAVDGYVCYWDDDAA